MREQLTTRGRSKEYRLDSGLDDVLKRVGELLRQYPVEQYGTELQCLIWMGPERGYKAVVSHEADERR